MTRQPPAQPAPAVEFPSSEDLVNTVPCPTCYVGTNTRCITRAGKPAREAHGRRYEALEQMAGITQHRAEARRKAQARGYTSNGYDHKAEQELLRAYGARLAARSAPTADADLSEQSTAATTPDHPTRQDGPHDRPEAGPRDGPP